MGIEKKPAFFSMPIYIRRKVPYIMRIHNLLYFMITIILKFESDVSEKIRFTVQ